MKLNIKPCECVKILHTLKAVVVTQEGQDRKETEALIKKITRQLTEDKS